jgi:hypothetical protein
MNPVTLQAWDSSGSSTDRRHRPQSGLVQHDIHAGSRLAAQGEIADVAFEELEAARGCRADACRHVVQVLDVAGREVVDTDHRLAEPEQILEQVRADESRHARDQEAARLVPQASATSAKPVIRGSSKRDRGATSAARSRS